MKNIIDFAFTALLFLGIGLTCIGLYEYANFCLITAILIPLLQDGGGKNEKS